MNFAIKGSKRYRELLLSFGDAGSLARLARASRDGFVIIFLFLFVLGWTLARRMSFLVAIKAGFVFPILFVVTVVVLILGVVPPFAASLGERLTFRGSRLAYNNRFAVFVQ